MPRPDVIIPPGELIYKYMSFSGSSASKKSNWAIISDAIESSIGVPKKQFVLLIVLKIYQMLFQIAPIAQRPLELTDLKFLYS